MFTVDWCHAANPHLDGVLPLQAAQLEHKEGTSPQLSPSVTDTSPVPLTLDVILLASIL